MSCIKTLEDVCGPVRLLSTAAGCCNVWSDHEIQCWYGATRGRSTDESSIAAVEARESLLFASYKWMIEIVGDKRQCTENRWQPRRVGLGNDSDDNTVMMLPNRGRTFGALYRTACVGPHKTMQGFMHLGTAGEWLLVEHQDPGLTAHHTV